MLLRVSFSHCLIANLCPTFVSWLVYISCSEYFSHPLVLIKVKAAVCFTCRCKGFVWVAISRPAVGVDLLRQPRVLRPYD